MVGLAWFGVFVLHGSTRTLFVAISLAGECTRRGWFSVSPLQLTPAQQAILFGSGARKWIVELIRCRRAGMVRGSNHPQGRRSSRKLPFNKLFSLFPLFLLFSVPYTSYFLRPFTSAPSAVAQIRSHKASSSPTSLLWCVPRIFVARSQHFRPSSTRVQLLVQTLRWHFRYMFHFPSYKPSSTRAELQHSTIGILRLGSLIEYGRCCETLSARCMHPDCQYSSVVD